MAFGAGVVAARQFGAAELVDPRPHAKPSIAAVFEKYPHIGTLLPAMGYGDEQVRDLQETINATPCDLVLAATPIDLRRLIQVCHPVDRVRYELRIAGRPTLEEILAQRFS
jgi:predicted GTPase